MSKHILVVSLVVLAFGARGQAADQHAGDQLHARGAHAMGFDQTKTTHHFWIFEDGGAIEVSANAASDTESIQAIRAHLPHIAQRFSEGDFSLPLFIHARPATGADTMALLKSVIRYRYEESAAGGRVRIETTDSRARAAVHAFLRFQITEHKTGDSLEVRRVP